MKKYLLLLMIMSSIAASSQQWSLPVPSHQRVAGLWAERRLKLPTDTAFTKEAGCLTVINGVLYLADGTKWNVYSAGGGSTAGVSTFDGRFGAVVPEAGDYTINMITGGLDSIRRRVDSIWVSGGSIFVRKGSNTNSFPISVDWVSGYPTYDARYASITRFLDTTLAIWNRIQSGYQPAGSYLLAANNLADVTNVGTARTNLNVYSKTEADARYLQSFTETDPTVYAWAKAATKPAYAVAEITGLQTALDGKQNVLGFTPVPDTRTINGAPLSANITLTKTDVGLSNVPNTDATNPANITQSSSFRFVTDTEKSTWNAKQNALGYTPENVANKGVANGYAALGSDSKILAYQLPQVAINQTFTVNSQSAMLALSANQGDIAVRTDQNKAYILAFTGASTLANWIALPGVSNEADPVFTGSAAFGITGTNISNWNTAFGWGNHAGLYRPVSWVPSWTDVTGRPTALSQFTNDAGFITGINSSMVTTALGYTPYNATNPNGFITASVSATSPSTYGFNITGTSGGARAILIAGQLGFSNGFTVDYNGTNMVYQMRDGNLTVGGIVNASTLTTSSSADIGGLLTAYGGTFLRPIYAHTGNGGYSISLGGSGGDYGSVGYNVNYTGTTNTYNYRVSDYASFIRFQSGGVQFFTAPIGTSGASMTPVNRYTMDVNGNNSWSGNGVFGGSLQINSRNFLYLGNTANTLYPSIRNMDTDGIGIYTNAGSALLEASAASGVSTNGRAFAAGAGSFSTLSASSSVTGRWFNILEASASRGGLYTYNVISGSGTDYSVGVFSEGDMFFATGGSATKKVTISSTGLLSGQSATFSGRMNADDYEMGSWRILDWAGVTAQIGGINASNWQQIDFYTNGTLRGSFTNTQFSSSLPASFSGGTAMTSGWNRTLELNASFPSIVFNSASQRWAGLSYDFSSNFMLRVGATSNDIFGSGVTVFSANSTTGAITFNNTVTAPQFVASSSGNAVSITSTGTTGFAINVAGSAGGARDIFLAGQTGFSNGFTVQYNGSAMVYNMNNGNLTVGGTISATRFFATSDIRLKNVFSEFKSADGINPIIYSFKNEFKPSWGYSAQQVQKEMSFAVTEGDDGYLRVDYQQVHTYKIMLLEKRIAELERRVNNGLPEQNIGVKISN